MYKAEKVLINLLVLNLIELDFSEGKVAYKLSEKE